MRLNIVLRYIGLILLLNAAFLLLSACVSLLNGMDTAFYPLLQSFLLTAILGAFPLIFVQGGEQISSSEGYGVVVGAWLMSCLMCMLPYMLWGGEFTLADAWFESVSGFTTTGSTSLSNVEALPKGLLFWRASTHWLGGVGVVMFVLVVLPSMGSTKMRLSSVELSSMAKDNFRYRTQKTLQILIVVYVGLTLIQTVLLKIVGMGWFDAVCNSFSTIATGGFCTRNSSIASFNNAGVEFIVMFFMLVSGLHFGLIYGTLTGKNNNIFKSEISKYYIFSTLAGGVVIAISLWLTDIYPNIWISLRYSLFQIISVASTTGFATADFNHWPAFSKGMLVLLMFIGASAGSTGGGIKVSRIHILASAAKQELGKLLNPRRTVSVRMDGHSLDLTTIRCTLVFFALYITITFLSTLLVSLDGYDLETNFTAVTSCISNVGPGLSLVGPMGNYGMFSNFSKVLLSFDMLVGRLEIYPMLILFLPSTWRKN